MEDFSDRKKKAIELAGQIHNSVLRKDTDEPHVTHCIRVGDILVQCGETDEDIVITGILHDVIEDMNPSNAFTIDIVRSMFGTKVWQLLEGSTEIYTHDNYPKVGHAQRKTLSKLRLKQMTPSQLKIRLADMIDTIQYIYSCAKKTMDPAELRTAEILLKDEKSAIDSLMEQLIDSTDATLKCLFHRAKNQVEFNLEKVKQLLSVLPQQTS